jgi:hypothetical protein
MKTKEQTELQVEESRVKSDSSPSCDENRQTEHSAHAFTQAQGRHHKKAIKKLMPNDEL